MKIKETGFEGLFIIEPDVYQDERGLFYESWRQSTYKAVGMDQPFLQDNVSISYKNVLRGLHCQEQQGQLVSVLQGAIFDVVVDLRPESKTFQNYFSVELSDKNHYQLYMPPGFAHGFYVLSEGVIMNYKCTQYYTKAHESGVMWNDPTINIAWPCGNPLVSQKDLQYPLLSV